MKHPNPSPILLACLGGAVVSIYLYMILILLGYQSEAVQNFFSFPVGHVPIAIFGRLPWCLMAQVLGTAILYGWWRRFPPASLRVTGGVLLGLVINALIVNALVLW